MKPTRLAATGLVLLLALAGCAADPDTPEGQIRALLAEAERNAEARDTGAVLQHVSEDYADTAGRDRQAVRGILAYLFLRHPEIHLLTRVHEIAVESPERAWTRVFVAMAGHPIGGASALAELRADLYRFDFSLRREGDTWRVVAASWAPAAGDDFR